MIAAPRHPYDYPDRDLDCQEALESRILDVIDCAHAAGWSVGDVTAALIELAENYRLKTDSITLLEQKLGDLLKRK